MTIILAKENENSFRFINLLRSLHISSSFLSLFGTGFGKIANFSHSMSFANKIQMFLPEVYLFTRNFSCQNTRNSFRFSDLTKTCQIASKSAGKFKFTYASISSSSLSLFD